MYKPEKPAPITTASISATSFFLDLFCIDVIYKFPPKRIFFSKYSAIFKKTQILPYRTSLKPTLNEIMTATLRFELYKDDGSQKVGALSYTKFVYFELYY